MSGAERYVAQYHASKAGAGSEVLERPGRGRMVLLTAAYTPMVAVGALPLTAVLAAAASVVANVTTNWVGVAVLVVAEVALGYVAARVAAGYEGVPHVRGWRRWLPLAASTVVVASGLAEIASGSRAPDPVMVLWFASMVWVAVFLPLAGGTWNAARRASWVIAPAVTFVTIVFVWTQGFFSLRFSHATADFDELARRVASGERVASGTHVGEFAVHRVDPGHIAGNTACDLGMWITGWHADDTRYIVHCTSEPHGNFAHLAGDWWQLEDKPPPSDL